VHCRDEDAKFKSHQPIRVVSLLGKIRVRRAYYYCKHCGQGDCPWDRKLALGRRRMTPAVEEVLTLAGATASFAKAEFILMKVGSIDVAESTVERVAEETGQSLCEAQSAGRVFEPRESWPWPLDQSGKRCGYVGLDGIHVRMQGPQGAAAESRVEYVGRIYIPPEASADGRGRTRYVVGRTLEEAVEQLQRQAQGVGGERVERWLCVTDGGAGLQARLERAFCFSKWILDFWHAAEYLRALAQALFADESERAAWVQQWCHALKHQGGQEVIRKLKEDDVLGDSSRPEHADVVRYFENQVEGMDYPAYTKLGWQIGSGPTEAACKVVVADRLKGSGMRWSADGAQEVSQVRALLLNGPAAWDGYWTARKVA